MSFTLIVCYRVPWLKFFHYGWTTIPFLSPYFFSKLFRSLIYYSEKKRKFKILFICIYWHILMSQYGFCFYYTFIRVQSWLPFQLDLTFICKVVLVSVMYLYVCIGVWRLDTLAIDIIIIISIYRFSNSRLYFVKWWTHLNIFNKW